MEKDSINNLNFNDEPLVSVVTPVHNGEPFLGKCIQSVLAQTYQNFEYIIVNNKSTDRTLEIIQEYAQLDKRIKVADNDHFVGMIENHNIAFSLISGHSKYCKVVCADDWLYPESITKLVELAERDPTVGIVGSYAINAKGILWFGFRPHDVILSGREVCQRYLLGEIYSFGTPSNVLYRSALIRSRQPFYPGSAPNADLAACLICLQTCNFGFVHQILSFERVHDAQASNRLRELNSFLMDQIEFLRQFGPIYLNKEEIADRWEELLHEYYACLASGICNFRGREFWSFHRRRMRALGYPISASRLTIAASMKFADLLFNPKRTLTTILRRLRSDDSEGRK